MNEVSFPTQNDNNHKFYYFLLKWDTMLSNMQTYNDSIKKMIKMKTITLALVSKESAQHLALNADILELNQVLDDATKFMDHLRHEKHDMIKTHWKTIERYIGLSRKRKLLKAWRQRLSQRQCQRNVMQSICSKQYHRQCVYVMNRLSAHSITERTVRSKEKVFGRSKQWYLWLIAFVIYKFTHSRLLVKKYKRQTIPVMMNFIGEKKVKYGVLMKMKTAAFESKLFHKIMRHRIELESVRMRREQLLAFEKWKHFNQTVKVRQRFALQQFRQNKQLKRKSLTVAAKMTGSILNAKNHPRNVLSDHFHSWSSLTKQHTARLSILLHIVNKHTTKSIAKSFRKLHRFATIQSLNRQNKRTSKNIQHALRQKLLLSGLRMNRKHQQQTMLTTWKQITQKRMSQKHKLSKCLDHIQSHTLQHSFNAFKLNLLAIRWANDQSKSSKMAQNVYVQQQSEKTMLKMSKLAEATVLRQAMSRWRQFQMYQKLISMRKIQSTHLDTMYQAKCEEVKQKAIALMMKRTAKNQISYWFTNWKQCAKKETIICDGLRRILRKQRTNVQQTALQRWKEHVSHLQQMETMEVNQLKARKNQKAALRVMANVSIERRARISLRFWRDRVKSQHSCKFVVAKYAQQRHRNNVQFAWNQWSLHVQHGRIREMKQLQTDQEEMWKQRMLQSAVLTMAKNRKQISAKRMFLRWRQTVHIQQSQTKSIADIMSSNEQRCLWLALRRWHKSISSAKMVKYKEHIRTLKEYAKNQHGKKQSMERKMKKKAMCLYLDSHGRNKCGKFFFKWTNYTQCQMAKKKILYQYFKGKQCSMLRSFMEQWMHQSEKRVHEERLYRLKEQFGEHFSGNANRRLLMKTLFAWTRFTVHGCLQKDSLCKILPICQRQLQRQTLRKWQFWIKMTDIQKHVEYECKQTEQFENELSEMRMSYVALEEDRNKLKVLQQYVRDWKIKVLRNQDQRVWIQKCLDTEQRARVQAAVLIWRRKIDAMMDAKEKAKHDQKVKALQQQFTHRFVQQANKHTVQRAFIQWKLGVDHFSAAKRNKIRCILNRAYKDHLYVALQHFHRHCTIQQSMEKLHSYFTTSWVSASLHQWKEVTLHGKERQLCLMRCIQIHTDLNAKHVLIRWQKVLSKMVEKRFQQSMAKQKLKHYQKLKHLCKMQTIDSIQTTQGLIVSGYFKQWKITSKALQRRKNILVKYIDYQNTNALMTGLLEWHAMTIEQRQRAQEIKRLHRLKCLHAWQLQCQSKKALNASIAALRARKSKYLIQNALQIWRQHHHTRCMVKRALEIAARNAQKQVVSAWRNKLYRYKLHNETQRASQLSADYFADVCYFSLVKAIDTAQRITLRSAMNIWDHKCEKHFVHDLRRDAVYKLCRYHQSKACKMSLMQWKMSAVAGLDKLCKEQTDRLYEQYYRKMVSKIFIFWQQKHSRNARFRSVITLHCIRKHTNAKTAAFNKWKLEVLGYKVNDQLVQISQHYDVVIRQIKDKSHRLFVVSQSVVDNNINQLQSSVCLCKWRIRSLKVQLLEKDQTIQQISAKYQHYQLQRVLCISKDRAMLRTLYRWKAQQHQDQAQKAFMKLFFSAQQFKSKYSAIYQLKLNVCDRRWQQHDSMQMQQVRVLQDQIQNLEQSNQEFALALSDIEAIQNDFKKRDAKLQAVKRKVKDYKFKAKENYWSSLIQHIDRVQRHKIWSVWKAQYIGMQQKKRTLYQIIQTQSVKVKIYGMSRLKLVRQYHVFSLQITALENKLEVNQSEQRVFSKREHELNASIQSLRQQMSRLTDTINDLTAENAKLMQQRLHNTQQRQTALLQQQHQFIQNISPQNLAPDWNKVARSPSNTEKIAAALLSQSKRANKAQTFDFKQTTPNSTIAQRTLSQRPKTSKSKKSTEIRTSPIHSTTFHENLQEDIDDVEDEDLSEDAPQTVAQWPSVEDLFH